MSRPPHLLHRAVAVPQRSARRLLHLGRAAGEMAAGAAVEGVARLARGEGPALTQLMLTPSDARRRAERMSTMRGAAMKVTLSPSGISWPTSLCDRDMARVTAAATEAGFIANGDAPTQRQSVIDLMTIAGEPLAHAGPYDFGRSDLSSRVVDLGLAQAMGEGYARTPPPDLLFLKHKSAGSFMLCARLKARVNLAEVFGAHL